MLIITPRTILVLLESLLRVSKTSLCSNRDIVPPYSVAVKDRRQYGHSSISLGFTKGFVFTMYTFPLAGCILPAASSILNLLQHMSFSFLSIFLCYLSVLSFCYSERCQFLFHLFEVFVRYPECGNQLVHAHILYLVAYPRQAFCRV